MKDKIIGFLYGLAVKYLMKKAIGTGNQQFVDDLNAAFASIEKIWKDLNAPTTPKK